MIQESDADVFCRNCGFSQEGDQSVCGLGLRAQGLGASWSIPGFLVNTGYAEVHSDLTH